MIRQDPIFKGCTRPAMLFGIPLVPLACVTGGVVLLSVWINLLVILVLVPLILVMKVITKSDDQKFRLLWLKLWCRFLPHHNGNGAFWQASAYSPLALKKRKR